MIPGCSRSGSLGIRLFFGNLDAGILLESVLRIDSCWGKARELDCDAASTKASVKLMESSESGGGRGFQELS